MTVELGPAALDRLWEATQDVSPVSGLTHTFYRYPARFSPRLAREVIQTFTTPGDLVIDPFMGGGTTLVEATALGRHAVGTDISALAAFVARVKTTLYSESELLRLKAWADSVQEDINMLRAAHYPPDWVERGYLRNLTTRRTWRLAKAIQQALASAVGLADSRLEDFARCAVLRTAQWALDARRKITNVQEFRNQLTEFTQKMLVGAEQYRRVVETAFEGRRPEPMCLNIRARQLDASLLLPGLPRPKLVLTSPPYPGVHMLYHRWQVDGRKETPAPFWIANQLDGSGAKYYMLGDHREFQLRSYYSNLLASFLSINRLCAQNTVVVQLVAFANLSWQLPEYLQVMNTAGFEELILPISPKHGDGRLWRKVPNRRWHADQKGETPSSREVVLIHRKRASVPMRPARLDRSGRSLHRPDHLSFGSSE